MVVDKEVFAQIKRELYAAKKATQVKKGRYTRAECLTIFNVSKDTFMKYLKEKDCLIVPSSDQGLYTARSVEAELKRRNGEWKNLNPKTP